MGNSYNKLVVAFVAVTGSFTFGFCNSSVGSIIGFPSFIQYFDLQPSASHTNSILGAMSGLFAGGSAIGALLLPWLADRFGRVRSLQLIALICIISAAIQAGAVHIAMFLVGRFFSGIGTGLIVTLVPVYMSEISPAKERGLFVGSHGSLIVTGYALSAWCGYGLWFSANPSFQWRFELAVQCISPIVLLCGCPWLPESPRWLVDRDRKEEALRILCRLHPDQEAGAKHIKAREEFYQMSQQSLLDRTMTERLGKWALFTQPTYRKRLFCGMLTFFLCQSTGVLVINNFQVLLYNGLGLYDSIPLLLYAVYLTWAAFLNVVSQVLQDRFGRVNLLLVGLIGTSLSIACETAMVAEYSGTTNRVGNGFGVFFLFLFVTFFATFLDVTEYVYCAEIFPTHVRTFGMGMSIFSQATSTVLYTQVAPAAFTNIGWKYYLVFILVPLSGVPLVWKYFPETKGLSLEEIAGAFGEKVAVDITHLDTATREALDRQLADIQIEDLIDRHGSLADVNVSVRVHPEKGGEKSMI